MGSSRALRRGKGPAASLPSAIRQPPRPAPRPLAVTGAGGMEEDEEEDEKVDPDAEGVAKMRASEIKAELDVRGVSYAGIFEKVRALGVKSRSFAAARVLELRMYRDLGSLPVVPTNVTLAMDVLTSGKVGFE